MQDDVLQLEKMSFDRNDLETLCTVIDSLHQCYVAHKQALVKKRDILTQSGMPAIERLTALQAVDRSLLTLSQRARQLEQERINIQRGMGCEALTLTQLIAVIPPGMNGISRKLQALQQKLMVALKEGKNLNNEIKSLLELSIDWVRDTIDIFSKAAAPEGASYGAFATKPNRSEGATVRPGLNSTISHSA
jgi:FlgN protein